MSIRKVSEAGKVWGIAGITIMDASKQRTVTRGLQDSILVVNP